MAQEDEQSEGVIPGDSDRYQRDSDPDSNGYHPEDDPDLRPLIDAWKAMTNGWWNQAGYETFWDYVQHSEATWARMGFDSIYRRRRKRPKTQELPVSAPPQLDLGAVVADATRPRRPRDKQVNVRLTALGYDALCEAAGAYGIRPTTLARLLLHRGAVAILEEHKARPGSDVR